MKLRIFQYTAPQDTQDDTRWIAARIEEQADREAKDRGWVKRAYDGEIYQGVDLSCFTARDLKRAGCDVVLT